MPHRILFVCLGNICRSPLAEAAMRRAVDERDFAVEIESAGTGEWHVGLPPDERAQAVARTYGIEIGGYRARQVTLADFTAFDEIVAMDADNLSALEAMRPTEAKARLSLLLDHVSGRSGQSVVDPYYGGEADFETTWADVDAGARALAKALL